MAEQNGMEKPDLQALPTINDRMTFLYLEHCKIHREDGAIRKARCTFRRQQLLCCCLDRGQTFLIEPWN